MPQNGGGFNLHNQPQDSHLTAKKIGGSPDFQLEPNCSISQANRTITADGYLTGLDRTAF
jgi:hypothetical protein